MSIHNNASFNFSFPEDDSSFFLNFQHAVTRMQLICEKRRVKKRIFVAKIGIN